MLTDLFIYHTSVIWIAIGIMFFGLVLSAVLFGIARYQEAYMQGKINGNAGMKGNRLRIKERCKAAAIMAIFFVVLPGFIMLLLAIS